MFQDDVMCLSWFPTEEFANALKNKNQTGCWDWWFDNANWYGNSKSLMEVAVKEVEIFMFLLGLLILVYKYSRKTSLPRTRSS